jgi:dTDP-4-amino-4,6-dideoxygalactose transaminase
VTPDRHRIPLSVPHLAGGELAALEGVLQSNWLASVGPETDGFEADFASHLGVRAALATTTGTSALHLALRVLGIKPGDEVFVSTLTFCASVNPILYLGATPVFVDAEARSWNMDPALLVDELDRRGRAGRLPAAVIVVHLFGQVADMAPISAACNRWGVPIVEDAAESLGASYRRSDGTETPAGALGTIGIFSFDGSKTITTSIGGMLVSDREDLVAHAKKLARQAREPEPFYQHEEMGYNYRMSNLLAAVGRVQLGVVEERVRARRAVFAQYATELAGIPGLTLQAEMPWGRHTRWLTCLQLDPALTTVDREALRLALDKVGIECRAVWKPMHLQPVYQRLGIESIGGSVAAQLFERGLCLPSSSSLTPAEVSRVAATIRATLAA